MNIQEREQNGVIIFELSGRIIGGPDATLLNDRLHELVDVNHRKFIVDLSQIDWMNSSGLGILINAHSMIQNAGGKFKIAAASEKIMNLFTITKLVSKFSLYKTVDEALAAF
jgi:anti-sigma B factor antagonist